VNLSSFAVIASSISKNAEAPSSRNVFSVPLTFDELDGSNTVPLTRQGDAPWVSPDGMVCDGIHSRYRVEGSDLPAWAKAGSASHLSLSATIRAEGWISGTTYSTAVSLCRDDSTALPRVSLRAVQDSEYPDTADMVLFIGRPSGSTTYRRLNRIEWSYFRRWPELTRDTFTAKPQAVCFMDANTLLATAHYSNQFSMCYKLRVSDGSVIGSFKIGPESGISAAHVSAIARRGDGTYWFSEHNSGILYEVDLDASFTSGVMVATGSFDASATASTSAIGFAEIGGAEYLLIGEYLTSGTPYLYVIPGSYVVNGGVLSLADRAKRFVIHRVCQGLVYKDGDLYVSSNAFTSDGSNSPGRLYVVDLDSAMTTLADGATLTARYDWCAPSRYPEDIDFHPTTGEIWTSTEGLSPSSPDSGFMAIWHRTLHEEQAKDYATNNYIVELNTSGVVTVKINGQIFNEYSLSAIEDPGVLVIGGPPVGGGGVADGFFTGIVRDVVLSDAPFTPSDYADLISGVYEPETLSAIQVPLLNPDAETGNTTGWTDEVGALAAGSNPERRPWGSYYFDGGANALTIASQRVDLELLTGLSGAELDALSASGKIWAVLKWQQKGYSAGSDFGGMGLRTVDGSGLEQTLSFSDLVLTFPKYARWQPRAHSILSEFGTRSLDALMRSDRMNGINNDTYFDQIEMYVFIADLS